MPTGGVRKPLDEKFWPKVDRSSVCWLWTASLDIRGYGQLRHGPKTLKAHRVSWELHYGPVPAGMFVCHHCDTPRCVRPDHLFVGTNLDNSRDMIKKRRNYHVVSPERVARGERQAHAKLTDATVTEMRKRAASGETSASLSRSFGVSKHVAWQVVTRKSWKHVP